ncbi:alkaline phosphatase synthesis sensor protein PhoR [Clostridium beijerinckii]|nr:alkaline phosphatase synthesis sensor protein PhoR [Clostridium beijerinckii]OOM66195.1 alkaline phosphatase synthesis sensor protein PhoR [Clostridium beijerinckii]CUU49100.1 conserved protein of unknown function [Clostridium beijerinckii]
MVLEKFSKLGGLQMEKLHLFAEFIIFAVVVLVYVFKSLEKKNIVEKIKKSFEDKERIYKVLSPIIGTGFITIIKIDMDGKIRFMSPELEERLGYSKGELNGISIERISNKEELIIEKQNIEKLLRGELKSSTMDKRIKDNQGRWVWFHCNYSTVEIDDEKDKEFIMYCIDIDWRKQTENSLSQSFELNELLLNSIDTKIAAFDYNGDVIAVNKAMEEFCINNKINNQIKKGSSFQQVHTSLSGKDISKNVKRITKVREVFTGKRDSYTFESYYEQNLKKNWYLTSVSSLENEGGAIVSYTDITKRKELEEKLVKSEEKYRKLLSLLPVAVFLCGNDGIEYCNNEGVKLLRLNGAEDAIGRSLINYIHTDYKLDFMDKFMDPQEFPICGSSYGTSELFINSVGESVPVEIEYTNLVSDDENMSLFIIKDVSEKVKANNFKKAMEEKSKELKEAKEYDKVKTEFFANISHELRTPINIIFSALQVMGLKDNKINSFSTEKYTGMIKQNCYRLLRLVNNLIDITKIDSGFFNMLIKNYDIIEIIENITLSVAQYVENRNIELIFDTEVEEKVIACDPDKIERIILNILANSVKFTPEGGQIMVNIYDRSDEIQVSVRDTGVGIPKDKLNIIFERFRQVDKTLSRNREGSGIGLSLVKSLVELHGGRIEVKSDVGKGSEFIFTLPVRTIEDNSNLVDKASLWQENVEKIDVEFSDIYA